MKSPVRLFGFISIVCFIVGFILGLMGIKFDWYGLNAYPVITELELARFMWRTGQIDAAIGEYQRVIDLSPSLSKQAYQELTRLLSIEKSGTGWMTRYLAYGTWALPPLFYASGLVFSIFTFGVFLAYRLKRRPMYVILPFQDYSRLGIGENLSQDAADRLRELIWCTEHLESSSHFIAEELEVPSLGMIGEGGAIDSVALLDTALKFAGAPSEFSINRLVTSAQMWLDQPDFFIRGQILKTISGINLSIRIIDGKEHVLKKSWHIEIKESEGSLVTQVIDDVIFVLLFHLSDKLHTRSWQSLKYLLEGFEYFEIYQENPHQSEYLQAAQETMTKALLYDPTYMIAKYNFGLLCLQAGNYEEARGLFKEASETTSDANFRRLAQFNYGVALFHLSQVWAYKCALEVFNNLLETSDDESLNDLLHSTLALTYSRLGMYDSHEKATNFNMALTEADCILGNNRISKECKANAFAAKGYICVDGGDFPEAINNFTRAVEDNPNNALHLIGLGQAYLKNRQLDRAQEVFARAERLSYGSGFASYKLGEVFRELGEVDKATNAYQRSPRIALAHVNLGKIYLENRELEKALSEFRVATELNKSLTEAWNNIAWTIMETEVEDQELLKFAEQSARRALQLEKNPNQLWHRRAVLARVLLGRKKYERGYVEAKKAVEGAPRNPQAIYYLALSEYYLEHYQEAMVNTKRVLEIDHGDWNLAAKMLVEKIKERISEKLVSSNRQAKSSG